MKNHQLFHLGVKALILNKNNEILLVQKHVKNLAFPDKAFWDFPGGRVEKGSTINDTLLKEIKEEINLDKKKIKISRLFNSTIARMKNPTDEKEVNLILFVYLCRLVSDFNISLSFEHVNYKWCPIKEAKKLLSHKYPKDFIKSLDGLR